MTKYFTANKYSFDTSTPTIMGILNMTPDSFSDGGKFNRVDVALKHAEAMLKAGVDIIDIGGESTRPGAKLVSTDEELARIVPVIEAIQREKLDVCLSIDTNKPDVMREVIDLDIDIINDVKGFTATDAIDAVANSSVGLCIMHMQGLPETMQHNPHYDDVLGDVKSFLHKQAEKLKHAGVAASRVCIDPGFGFGKTPEQNMLLLKHTRELCEHYPVLFGLSRKSTLGVTLGDTDACRETASVVGALLALQNGASIVRVHDVKATADAIKIWQTAQMPERLR